LLVSVFCLLQLYSVAGLTNGTLLPSYLCGPSTDGFPKSLGGVLKYFQLTTNPGPSTAVVPLNRPLDFGAGGRVNNTQLLVANFHNRNNVNAFKMVIHVNISLKSDPTVVGVIVPGAVHLITLLSTPDDLGVVDLNVAIDGAIVYANDLMKNRRVGKFLAFGDNMMPWAPCGPNAVGVVHTGLLSDTGAYVGLEWWAPWDLADGQNVTFMGAAVTDNGFGAHITNIPVKNVVFVPPTPIITDIDVFGDLVVGFFIDPVKGFTGQSAASIFLGTVTFFNGTLVLKFNTTTSPFLFLLTKLNIRGQRVNITLVAANAIGKSAPTAMTVTIPLLHAAPDVNKVMAMCNGDYASQAATFGMDTDPNGGCAYRTSYVNEQITTTDAAAVTTPTVSSASRALPVSIMSIVFVYLIKFCY